MAIHAKVESAQYAPLPVWGRKSVIQELTGVPDKFLYGFATEHPEAVRKFGGGGRNGTLLFRLTSVLDAIEKVGR